MTASAPVPRYMEQLLEQLGWNQGTRIPLANPDNQALENLLIDRYNPSNSRNIGLYHNTYYIYNIITNCFQTK